MKYYVSALKKILSSWYVYVALFLDLIGIVLTYYSEIKVPYGIYIGILGIGFFLACMKTVAELLHTLDDSYPQVISNDNLSLGGPNLSIDSISLKNIGGGKAKVTNITADAGGKIRVIDEHYMESSIFEPGATIYNIMINEAKIIEALGANITQPLSIVQVWKKPFFIYIWYESLNDKNKFCTRIGFQAGNKFIRNLGWKQIAIKN